jgi:putative FmdB family regulatory protein
MPTYEYLCQACSHRFETWQKMVEEPLTTCPKCGEHIRRVLYPAGIVFKGSGFYKTDHGNGAVPVSSDSNGETKKTEDKSTTTGESKPSDKSSENGTSTKSTSDSKTPATTATTD